MKIINKIALILVGLFVLATVLPSCTSSNNLRGVNKYEGKMWKKKFKQQKQVENCW